MRSDSQDSSVPDIDRLLADYLGQLKDDETIDRERILAEHPAEGEELLRALDVFSGLIGDGAEEEPLGILGDYSLRRQIGRGGMGVVYEAWQASLDRQVALKVLPAGIAADAKSSTRFLREAQIAAKLSHPQIVSVFGSGVEAHTPYFAMEYVEGRTLAQILAAEKDAPPEKRTAFGFPRDDVAYYSTLARGFADVAEGLQHAHSKGVVHRDIKPSNLILDGDGNLRILDFGLARLEGQESLTLSGDLMGTVLYMSPEQAMAKRIPLDHRTDVYSLGATMYETLTGEPPFRGKDQHDTLSRIMVNDPRPPRQLNPRVPRVLETIVLKCLRKDPNNRYGTAEALGQDLRRVVRGDPIEARPEWALERLVSRLRRQKVNLAVGAGFLVLLLAAASLAYRSDQAELQAKRTRYEPDVREALTKLLPGRFSLKLIAGEMSEHLGVGGYRLSPVSRADVQDLLEAGGARSFETAIGDLKNAALAVPNEPDAHYHLAQAYAALGRESEARSAVARALECDPGFVPAKVLRWKLARGDSAELAAICSPFEGRATWETSWLVAYKSVEEEAWARGAESYEELIAVGRKKEPYIGCVVEAYLGRGVAQLEAENWVRAQQDFLRAAVLGAGIEPVLLLAKAYYLNQQEEDAQAVLGELYAEATPDEKHEVSLWIIALYSSLRDYEKGLEWLVKLGDIRIAERSKSYFLFMSGRMEEAIDAGRKAIARYPRDLMAHLILSSALLTDLRAASGLERVRRIFELLHVSRTASALSPEDQGARSYLATAETEWKRTADHFLRRTGMRHPRPGGMFWTVALTLVFGEAIQAQALFDDFEDGELLDGRPVAWGPECTWSDGEWEIIDGNLQVRNANDLNAAMPMSVFLEGDVSLRTEFKFIGPGSLRLGLHATCLPVNVYFGGLQYSGEVKFNRWVNGVHKGNLVTAQLPAFAPDEWHRIKFDRIGNRLELRVWRPEDPMPLAPQLELEDASLQRGQPMLSYIKGAADSRGAFRFVEVLTPTPEPEGPEIRFRRGECNGDNRVDLADAVCALGWLFDGGAVPACIASLNVNGDDDVNVADAVSLLNFLFGAGPAPVVPFPDCAPSLLPADEELGVHDSTARLLSVTVID